MIEIGGRPILWHIMKSYSAHGINEFIICCGYRGYIIKEYFSNYFLHMSDVTFDMAANRMEVHQNSAEPWKVTLVDTGEHSMTGGRLGRVRRYLENDDAFCFTYGDGVSDVDISALVAFHKAHGKHATVTAIEPGGRYGALDMVGSSVNGFMEKPKTESGWVNGGYFVLSPAVLDLITADSTIWEKEPLMHLAATGQLEAYRHHGFWQAMDTLREKTLLEQLWESGRAPWKSWR
jgi:glucose-1-phosphate cytidylyltransferase